MDELERICKDYAEGKLDFIKADLERCIATHREEILALKKDPTARHAHGEISDEVAVKLFLLKNRSVNPLREILEQKEEIEKEKWIKGVQLHRPPDSNEVAQEWAKLYSPGWRDHRVLTIVYVFEQEKERYVSFLHPK